MPRVSRSVAAPSVQPPRRGRDTSSPAPRYRRRGSAELIAATAAARPAGSPPSGDARRRPGVVPSPPSTLPNGGAMALGPVEYIVVGFPGNRFDGHIAPELAKLVEAGTIRILDLVFITKDDDGDVAIVELEDHHDAESFHLIDGEIGGFVSHEDVEYAAAELEPGSSAALLVWEDVWATPFVEALRNSGAVLLEGARIPHDLVEDVEAALVAAG